MTFWKTKKKAPQCGLCHNPLGSKPGKLRYKAMNEQEEFEVFEMKICKKCADEFDAADIDKDEPNGE